jgi:hypothetical protein
MQHEMLADVAVRYSYVALFYNKNRLYQIEGKAFVAGGQAEAAEGGWGRRVCRLTPWVTRFEARCSV